MNTFVMPILKQVVSINNTMVAKTSWGGAMNLRVLHTVEFLLLYSWQTKNTEKPISYVWGYLFNYFSRMPNCFSNKGYQNEKEFMNTQLK